MFHESALVQSDEEDLEVTDEVQPTTKGDADASGAASEKSEDPERPENKHEDQEGFFNFIHSIFGY